MHPDSKTKLFTLIVILTNVLGNFALSWGMKHGVENFAGSPLEYFRLLLSPYVVLGMTLLIVWVFTRMALLSWADLSYVLPVTSIGYVANTVMGKVFFDEKVTPARWLGTLCIVGGMVLVGTTAARTTQEPPGGEAL